jgi:hypothetical protein
MDALAKLFEGEPKTEISTNGQGTTITVAMRHLRPFDALSADETGSCLAIAAVGLAGWIGYEAMDVTAPAVGLFLSGLFGRPLLQKQLRVFGHVTATIRFTDDSIFLQTVKKAPWWEPESEWHRFDRSHDHRFVLKPHHKARAEKDEIDHQIRNKPGARVARYYGDCFFVALEYLGQRFDIAEVMGERQANAILDRLAFCDKYMGDLANNKKGLPMRAEDEWSGPTGSIPQ